MAVLRTTRGRLTLIALAVLAAALVLANLGLDVGFAYAQRADAKSALQAQAQLISRGIRIVGGKATYQGQPLPGEFSNGEPVGLAVVGSQGVIGTSAGEPLSDPTLIDVSRPVLRSSRPLWVDLYDRHQVHRSVYAVPVSSAAGPPLVLIASTPLGQEESSARQAMLLFALFSLAMLALGCGAVYLMVGRALRPVGRIAGLAGTLSEHELHRRVEVEAPDDELGVLVRTFNQMLSRLQISFEALRRFTADASHELRAPLAIIAAEVEVVLSRPRTSVEYVRALGVVEGEVADMTRMIERLLLLARADAGELLSAPEEIDVADLINETAARWRAPAAKRRLGLDVITPDSGVVQADPDLLRRILDNLLDNALRHAPPGSAIRLSAGVQADDWVFEVADRGPGVPESERERIFARFVRGDSARSRNGDAGCGLGLALSSSFAAVQHGHLSVEREPGWGAVFRLTLPNNRPGTAPAAPAAGQPSPAAERATEPGRGERLVYLTAPLVSPAMKSSRKKL